MQPDSSRPVLLCLPAMGVAAGFYARFAQHLSEATGAAVEVLELRGQGAHEERAARGADYGYREIVEIDIPAAVDRIEAAHAGRPVYLVGHSLGGQLAVMASAALAARLAGLVLIAAGTAHYRAWPAAHRWRARLVLQAIRAMASLLPWYPGRLLGFGGNQPRRFMRDWSFNAFTGRYRLEGSRRSPEELERAMRAVRCAVLSIAVREDPVAPPGAEAELLAKLSHARIERSAIEGITADRPWRRHFSWARAPGEVGALIAAWLDRQIREAPIAARR